MMIDLCILPIRVPAWMQRAGGHPNTAAQLHHKEEYLSG